MSIQIIIYRHTKVNQFYFNIFLFILKIISNKCEFCFYRIEQKQNFMNHILLMLFIFLNKITTFCGDNLDDFPNNFNLYCYAYCYGF